MHERCGCNSKNIPKRKSKNEANIYLFFILFQQPSYYIYIYIGSLEQSMHACVQTPEDIDRVL